MRRNQLKKTLVQSGYIFGDIWVLCFVGRCVLWVSRGVTPLIWLHRATSHIWPHYINCCPALMMRSIFLQLETQNVLGLLVSMWPCFSQAKWMKLISHLWELAIEKKKKELYQMWRNSFLLIKEEHDIKLKNSILLHFSFDNIVILSLQDNFFVHCKDGDYVKWCIF